MRFGRRESDRAPGERREVLRLEPSSQAGRVRSAAVNGLFILACLYTLRAAREFLMPLVIGVMLYFLLVPIVRALRRAGLPEAGGAAVVVVSLIVVVGLGAYALSWPATAWMARAPDGLKRVESKLKPVFRGVEKLSRTAQKVEEITASATEGAAPEVKVKEPGIGATVLGGMQSFLGGSAIVLTLVYFLLASGDNVLRKVVQSFPRLADRRRAETIARDMEEQISAYLLLTTMINALFGVVVALTLWLMGMPNPMLWGAVAAVTNFIPYLGSVIATGVIGLAALVAFESVWWALAVPAVFFLLNTLEGYVITPMLMGRRFTLDPALLFVGLLFWWFVWGTAGALLAVPMMAAFKIFCERVEGLQRIAAFLGDEAAPAAEPAREPAAVVSAPPA
jgi:predicted PurR-regulated permease PerM